MSSDCCEPGRKRATRLPSSAAPASTARAAPATDGSRATRPPAGSPATGLLYDEVVARLARAVPHARPTAVTEPPVLGAALDALDAAGATPAAAVRLRAALCSYSA